MAVKINRYFEERSKYFGDKDSNAFLIRLYGGRGSGKTSILHILREELRNSLDRKFLVIELNAWQHQLIEPRWWPLLDTIVSRSIERSSPVKWYRKSWIWIRDIFFHKISGRHRNILIIAVIFFAVLGFDLLFASKNIESLTSATKSGQQFLTFLNAHVAAIVALVGSVIGAIRAFGYSLLPNSSDSAKDLMKSNRDPMNSLNSYFIKLVKRIGNPTVILVDDVDHCKSDYKLEFLQVIKTLFTPKTNIVFVITTDKLSLYNNSKSGNSDDSIDEMIRIHGYDIFDISLALPNLQEEHKKRYLELLLGTNVSKGSEAYEGYSEQMSGMLAKLNSNQEIVALIDNEKDFSKKQILKEEAISRIFSPEIERNTEHYLERLVEFMDPNPSFIKRFVNQYQIWMAKLVVSGMELSREDLARWVIITLRWPFLVDYLEENFDLTSEFDRIITQIGGTKGDKIDKQLKKQKENLEVTLREMLLSDPTLWSVINGNGEISALNGNTIRKLLTV